MAKDISQLAKKLGQRGGAQTKKKGRDYYRQIGKLGLAKRYKKPVSTDQQYSFDGLTLLPVPVPPILEKAVGYPGDARFVSFYWTPGGDEADYDDGQRADTGEWQGYLAYIQHPVVHPLLAEYNLGSSDSEAKHALILDRQERKLYVASRKDTQTFLAQQWPKVEPIHFSQEEWTAMKTQLLKSIKQNRNIEMDEIHRRIEEQSAHVEALQNWLDRLLPN